MVGDPKEFLQNAFQQALMAVNPLNCLPPFLPSRPSGRVIVIGAGKGAAAMAKAVEENWSGPMAGIVFVPDGYRIACQCIDVRESSHPIPDWRSLAAARDTLRLVENTTLDDLVVCLLSGGASSLIVSPITGVSLEEKQSITGDLLRSGADIQEINCVRKHISTIKGGKLAQACEPANLLTFIISDVVGDDPTVIASGPTVADPTTCRDALGVLDKYRIQASTFIRRSLLDGSIETPKTQIVGATHHIIARSADGLNAAQRWIQSQGINAVVIGKSLAGEARHLAEQTAVTVDDVIAGRGCCASPCVLLSGGETTVTVKGTGRGGPNMEFSLALALALKGQSSVWAMACDTDGADGSSDAAGAFIDPTTLDRISLGGNDAESLLNNNASLDIFSKLGDLIMTGPTYTNINDFRAILIL